MKEYKVTVTVFVEAMNKQEAEELARQELQLDESTKVDVELYAIHED